MNEEIKKLNYLYNLVVELSATNSQIQKVEILKKYYDLENELFKKWMYYIYDYEINYWVTDANLKKHYNDDANLLSDTDEVTDIFKVLDVISKREKTGYDAIYFVNNFIKYAKDIDLNYEELIYKIINKDLKINVGVALINRAVPQTIKQFEVALAETFNFANESRTHKIDFSKKNYSIMQKLDGCRCIAIHNDFGINFYSRKGKMFHTVEALKTDIEKADIKNKYVLDGELCVIDENGLENFQSIMKQIARKNYQIKEFVFVVFDMIKYEDFNATVSDETYSSRFNKLADLVNKNKFNHIKLIRHKLNGSDQDFTQWSEIAKQKQWEGLMLRDLDSKYEGKRTFDLIKCKMFNDAEYIVEGVEFGTKPFLINGIMVEKECVASLIIYHKGFKVNVGSGMDNQQRLEWFKNPNLIIGKEVTIQFFEETVDDKGSLSLRFPTIKYIYENKRDL